MPARLKVLFVCAMNKQRSVTAERLYRNDPRLEVRSAGVNAKAARRLSEADLNWADLVYVMESDQKPGYAPASPTLICPESRCSTSPTNFQPWTPSCKPCFAPCSTRNLPTSAGDNPGEHAPSRAKSAPPFRVVRVFRGSKTSESRPMNFFAFQAVFCGHCSRARSPLTPT